MRLRPEHPPPPPVVLFPGKRQRSGADHKGLEPERAVAAVNYPLELTEGGMNESMKYSNYIYLYLQSVVPLLHQYLGHNRID
jgi:hypothetical protein